MDLLAHPFRLGPRGAALTVPQGGDAALEQGVVVHALTRRGERPLEPQLGVTDPVYGATSLAELNTSLALHGPDVVVTDVAEVPVDERSVRTTITWDRADGGGGEAVLP